MAKVRVGIVSNWLIFCLDKILYREKNLAPDYPGHIRNLCPSYLSNKHI
jgi:hypothetical protein